MIKEVKTHIISGFLGAGKSSAIQFLMTQKPAHEVWAILVNEFGEVGIDQALLSVGPEPDKRVVIQEVPGGCMCCAAGVPMGVALNKLLKAAQPDRLLIEPTGLGHPQQVLKALTGPQYNGVLNMQGVITLVDARQIQQARYREHDIFKQQLAVADLIIANKADLYRGEELAALETYVAEQLTKKPRSIRVLSQAQLPFAWLTEFANLPPKAPIFQLFKAQTNEPNINPAISLVLAESVSHFTAQQSEYFSCGWVFAKQQCFDKEKLLTLLASLNVIRLKGVMQTNQGIMIINQVNQEITVSKAEHANDSRIELISDTPIKELELLTQLKQCLLVSPSK
ncbi:GTP-binding protein [Motilimonas cestriensis]|uniref:GTP-binding protein n=1 Tax=Motilimonas cestriensis TaxID=2742685 RepID=A0ABS8W680_9GAMM|nr:GTP-binding protein [Motilimonas cestriensis]MCE2593790.1 GTP-binding protein [Motilimonas cestriensis]